MSAGVLFFPPGPGRSFRGIYGNFESDACNMFPQWGGGNVSP